MELPKVDAPSSDVYVTHEDLNAWDIDIDTVFDIAESNSFCEWEIDDSPIVHTLSDSLKQELSPDVYDFFRELLEEMQSSKDNFIVSSYDNYMGAIQIKNFPKITELLEEFNEKTCFLTLPSTNGVQIHRIKGDFSSELKQLYQYTSHFTRSPFFLSQSVYFFNGEETILVDI